MMWGVRVRLTVGFDDGQGEGGCRGCEHSKKANCSDEVDLGKARPGKVGQAQARDRSPLR